MTDIPDRLTSDDPSELASAEAFVAQHGDRVRWSKAAGWRLWTGTHWAMDGQDQVMRLAKVTARSMVPPPGVVEEKALARWGRHIGLTQNAAGLSAMLRLAASEEGIAVEESDFDTDPWLLNVRGGTLDLHTGALRPAAPTDLLTKLAPVVYDPAATCPRWLAFLDTTFDGNVETIRFVQKWVGYCLTGRVTEQALVFLHGAGRNGKSTFVEVLQALMGDYAIKMPMSTLLASRNDNPPWVLAELPGKRLAVGSEIAQGRQLNEELVKDLTGGDQISVCRKHLNPFQFHPCAKWILYGNHEPALHGVDEGIRRRIRLVPFAHTITAAEDDPNLKDVLLGELPGILNWALTGCALWQAEGLTPPAVVTAATNAYFVGQDALAPFLGDRVVVQAGAQTSSKALYQEYRSWADEAGIAHPLSAITFGRALRERGYSATAGAGNVLTWQGLGLLAASPRVSVSVGRSGHVADNFVPPCPTCGAARWRGYDDSLICPNCQHGGED